MKEDEYSLGMLTVYQYSKNKIKCDYSIIPVSWIDSEHLQSGVSKEKIDAANFKISKNKDFLPSDYIKFDKQKEGDGCKVSILSEGSIELVEKRILKKLYKEFRKHFWYKFKYKKFLDKKKKMGQINF